MQSEGVVAEVATEKGSDPHLEGRALRISLPSYTIQTGYGTPWQPTFPHPEVVGKGFLCLHPRDHETLNPRGGAGEGVLDPTPLKKK